MEERGVEEVKEEEESVCCEEMQQISEIIE